MVYYGRAPPPIPHMKTTYLDDNMNGLKPKQNLLSRNASSVDNAKPIKNQQKIQRSSISTSGSFEDTASHHETTSSVNMKNIFLLKLSRTNSFISLL